MRQSQTDQFTLNEFQGINSQRNLGKYLPEIFEKFNKFIKLCILNLSCSGPVFKIFNSLNMVLILAILALSMVSIRTWISPKYPYKVNNTNLAGTPRELAPLMIKRQNHPPQKINEVVSNNLFRKERDQYIPPIPPSNTKKVQTAPVIALPSPELSLRGVMLLNGTKIAILEGFYQVMNGDKTEKKSIKRKGYYLGDQIGDYQISRIERRAVTLHASSGKKLNIKLIRRLPNLDKTSKKKLPKIISTQTAIKKNSRPKQRISGALTVAAPRHISGR